MIAEWVMTMLLGAEHKYKTLRQWHKKHVWKETGGGEGLFTNSNPTCEQRVGILGYGAFVRQVANVDSLLGMEVIA